MRVGASPHFSSEVRLSFHTMPELAARAVTVRSNFPEAEIGLASRAPNVSAQNGVWISARKFLVERLCFAT